MRRGKGTGKGSPLVAELKLCLLLWKWTEGTIVHN